MLAKRIIPCLDVKDGFVVKGIQFENLIKIDDPKILGKYYSDHGADELVFYDISASYEARSIFTRIIKETASSINIPFTVGGGIRGLEDFYIVLNSGADKVSVNSGAVKNPSLITEAANRFGSQCVVLSMDVKTTSLGKWDVFINGGRVNVGKDPVSWALEAESLGAGEIVVNSIDADGVKKGYDNIITSRIARAVKIPVIASGGAGNFVDFKEAFLIGQADGALAASVFHNKEIEIFKLKQYLSAEGITIRM